MSGSRPCVGLERLGDARVAGGEVQEHAVLELRVRLVVDVDADLVRVEQPLELLDPDRRTRRAGSRSCPWTSIRQRSRCTVERPTNSMRGRPWDARPAGRGGRRPGSAASARRRMTSSAVGTISGSKETRRSTLARSSLATRAAALRGPCSAPPPRRGIGSVRKPRTGARRSANSPAGTISGRKTTTACGREGGEPRAHALGVARRRGTRRTSSRIRAASSSSAQALK